MDSQSSKIGRNSCFVESYLCRLVERGRKARIFMCHAQFLLYIFGRLKLHNWKLLTKLFLPNFSVYAAHMTIFLYHTQNHVAWQFCNKLVEFFCCYIWHDNLLLSFFFLMEADLQLHMCAQCSIFFLSNLIWKNL